VPADSAVTSRARVRPPRRLRRQLGQRADILGVIAIGGALGSLARYGLAEAFPHPASGLAWGTVIANVSGAFALGALMVFVVDAWPTTRLVRPFLGVGVLGGYTTFSTMALDTRSLAASGELGRAGLYLFGTVVVGLLAVWAGIVVARGCVWWLRARQHRRTTGGDSRPPRRS